MKIFALLILAIISLVKANDPVLDDATEDIITTGADKIGPGKCQVASSQFYAVWNLKKMGAENLATKLKKFKAKGISVLKLKTGKKPDSYLIYSLCGLSFKPEKIEKSMQCKNMKEGNMYLIQGTKCQQSFDSGTFDPQSLKQWTLSYSSLQDCYAKKGAKSTVTIKGSCGTAAKSVWKTESSATCANVLTYTSKNACVAKVIPIQQILNKLQPFFGAILILFGFLLCFFGARFLSYVVSALIWFFVTMLIWTITYNFLPSNTSSTGVLIGALAVCGLLAAGVAYLAFKVQDDWLTTILGLWGGIALALMLSAMVDSDSKAVQLGIVVLGAIGGGFAGYKSKGGIEKIATSFIGAFFIIRGAAFYLGKFPETFKSTAALKKIANKIKQTGKKNMYFWAYLVAMVALFIGGFVFQLYFYRDEGKDGEDFMEMEDESRVCGCF